MADLATKTEEERVVEGDSVRRVEKTKGGIVIYLNPGTENFSAEKWLEESKEMLRRTMEESETKTPTKRSFKQYIQESKTILRRETWVVEKSFQPLYSALDCYSKLFGQTNETSRLRGFLGHVEKRFLPDIEDDSIRPTDLKTVIAIQKEFERFLEGFSGKIGGLREKYSKAKLSNLTKVLGNLDRLNKLDNFLGKTKDRLNIASSILGGCKAIMSLEYGLAVTKEPNVPLLMEDMSEEEIKKRCKRYNLIFDNRFIKEEIVNRSIKGEIPFRLYKSIADRVPKSYIRFTPMEEREAEEYSNLASDALPEIAELLKSSLQEYGRNISSHFSLRRVFTKLARRKGGMLFFYYRDEEGKEAECSVKGYLQEVVDLQKQISALNNRTEGLTLDDKLYGELVREKVSCHESIKSVWRKFQGILNKGYWSFTDNEPVLLPKQLYEERRGGVRMKEIPLERKRLLVLGRSLEYAVFNNHPEFRKKYIN